MAMVMLKSASVWYREIKRIATKFVKTAVPAIFTSIVFVIIHAPFLILQAVLIF